MTKTPIEQSADLEVERERAQVAERDIQEKCRRLVQNEVQACVSALVSDLAKGYGSKLPEGLGGLVEEAAELCSPVPDYEEAALQEGIKVREVDGEWQYSTAGSRKEAEEWTPGEGDEESDRPDAWTGLGASDEQEAYQEACEEERVEPYEREIYEHWIISGWLRGKLEEKGERVGDLAGLDVWGRPTTGQAILLDGVIRDIVRELHKEPVA